MNGVCVGITLWLWCSGFGGTIRVAGPER